MKVFYLTSSAYSDNQINLIHHFPEEYELTYGVIIPSKNSNYTEEELSSYCEQHNIRFLPFKLKYRFRNPLLFLSYYRIIKTIKSTKPDVVLFANFDQLYLNLMLLLLNPKNTIIAMHDVSNHSKTAFDKLVSLSKTILFKNFNRFLTYSKSQSRLLNERYPGKKIYTIPLPLIGFGKPEILTPRKNKNVTFLFFGNIQHYKGLDILLKAVNRLSKRYSNFRLLIAGRCTDWEELYAPLVLNKELVSVNIGFIKNEDIPQYFLSSDYLILPYRDTTQSGPLMIAYHYNTPVIASNAVGFREFFEEQTSGYMFDLEIPNDIDRVLAEAIERTEDDYLELRKRQKEYVNSNYSMEKLVKSYQTMFNETAGKKQELALSL